MYLQSKCIVGDIKKYFVPEIHKIVVVVRHLSLSCNICRCRETFVVVITDTWMKDKLIDFGIEFDICHGARQLSSTHDNCRRCTTTVSVARLNSTVFSQANTWALTATAITITWKEM